MDFQIGVKYSDYEFLDILKRSREGVEFRVRNMRDSRLEALRALPENAQDDPERSERFLREMRVHASLAHPNIVTLFSAFELENHLVMTRELVEGPTLADKLQLGPLPWEEAVALARQAAAALAYAHEQKIVHRDICPENITITPEGLVKLANFALAKAASSPKLTQVGMPIGNLKYISPEQIKGVGDLDARSDIYSLGMVLYEMLCGRPAFDSESQFELMAAQVAQPPRAPSEVNPAVPREIGAVVLKALSKDTADRYQTSNEFDAALVKAAEQARFPRSEILLTTPSLTLPGALKVELVPDPVLLAAAMSGVVARSQSLPADEPEFLDDIPSPVFSKRFILIGGAAGALVGMVLMSIWLIIR